MFYLMMAVLGVELASSGADLKTIALFIGALDVVFGSLFAMIMISDRIEHGNWIWRK